MIQLIRGFKDILPGESELWQYIEKTAVDLFQSFRYNEIRIPIMEKTALFARSIGETTDIVEKEMYTLEDRKKDLLTLRPEATASIVRSYIQHKMYATDPVQKFYMIGPMFRRERPQKGRYRQFYQIDAEIFGVASPLADVELIVLLNTLMERLNVTDVEVHVNSLGCPECRPAYKEALTTLLNGVSDKLCANCVRRKDKNPLRVLDCKVPACQDAMEDPPALIDHLCDACSDHFNTVTGWLDRLKIPYTVNKRLVRGLDYYTRTAFEIQTGALGAQSAVAGGGRYDGLVSALGGPDQPAIGFAIGFDRLAEIVGQSDADYRKPLPLFIAALGATARDKAFDWCLSLGRLGIGCEMEYAEKSLKSQMKKANRLNAQSVLIVGDAEIENGEAVLRNMASKTQQSVPLENLIENVAKAINERS
ncbi:MAG: histidine--tRNA ligase [Desulfobacteraceae bacterium]|nr:histidine--tRNA ligase [Desulfobacteraceae bacterium]